jgi:hypothetical protein
MFTFIAASFSCVHYLLFFTQIQLVLKFWYVTKDFLEEDVGEHVVIKGIVSKANCPVIAFG